MLTRPLHRRSHTAARPSAPQLAVPRASVAARAADKQGELTGVVFEPFTAVKVRFSCWLRVLLLLAGEMFCAFTAVKVRCELLIACAAWLLAR